MNYRQPKSGSDPDSVGVGVDATPEQVLSALERLCQSDELSASERLQEFLAYVVKEALAGRSGEILGKTIAIDVYGRNPDFDGDKGNLVRVDAGRLRRRLNEYYAKSGVRDPVRIHIDPGSYAPRFEIIDTSDETAETQKPIFPLSRRTALGAGLLALAVIVAVFAWQFRAGPADAPGTNQGTGTRTIERQAILENSPASLQAFNLAKQAREVIFPATDPQRVSAARNMFEQATILDPDYFGGYAGLAQTMAVLAVLTPPGDGRAELLVEAQTHAQTASRLNPVNGWSQSALAWVAFVARDYDRANRLSKRAVQLDPDDLHVLDFDAIIALFSGDFGRVLASSNPQHHNSLGSNWFVFLSAFASSKFHTGKYDEAVDLFETNFAEGGMISPITIAYMIAANQSAGNHAAARRLVRQLETSWPASRLDILFSSLFENADHAQQVLSPLKQAGWSPTQK